MSVGNSGLSRPSRTQYSLILGTAKYDVPSEILVGVGYQDFAHENGTNLGPLDPFEVTMERIVGKRSDVGLGYRLPASSANEYPPLVRYAVDYILVGPRVVPELFEQPQLQAILGGIGLV